MADFRSNTCRMFAIGGCAVGSIAGFALDPVNGFAGWIVPMCVMGGFLAGLTAYVCYYDYTTEEEKTIDA